MPKVTMKSTKQEMMDALREAERKLKEQKSIVQTPAEADAAATEKTVVEQAAEDVKSGMFSDEMNAKYENLRSAIELLDSQLKSRYEIDAGLTDMAVVISAKKSAIQSLDTELAARKSEVDAELEQAKRAAKAAMDAMRAEEERRKTEIVQDRKRESEQYEYDLARKRKIEQDQHDDKMAQLKKDTAAAEARLADLLSQIGDLDAMRTRLEDVERLLAEKYDAGVEDGKKQAGKEYGFEKTMAQKDHAYEIKSRDDAISRLEADVREKADKIAALENKLDAAYSQLRDLATKTVESSGGLKVISPGAESGGSKK